MSDTIQHILAKASELRLPAGQKVFSQGDQPENYVVVTEGCVRVFARSAQGREVVLYRVFPGQMCLLTTACLLGQTRYNAEGVTELPTVARVLPVESFEQTLRTSPEFQRFVFTGLSMRLASFTERFEHLMLDSVEQRVVRFLLEQSMGRSSVEVTQEQLALEIGSAREVVGRQLKALSTAGLIDIHRGRIEVPDRDALTALIPR